MPAPTNPQLNRDILREVFYEYVEKEGFQNIDSFMMAGRDQFELVLDICKQATNVIIFKDKIVAKLPTMIYETPTFPRDSDNEECEEPIIGFSTDMKLIKPISIALASTITSLDIRSFSPALIPMIESINHELNEVKIVDDSFLQVILKACTKIPNVKNGVTFQLYTFYYDYGLKFFAIPCRKLTIKNILFNRFCKGTHLTSSHLRNICDLELFGGFQKTETMDQELKEFVGILSTVFPKLKTLKAKFELKIFSENWQWNIDTTISTIFQQLPPEITGCISFKLFTHGHDVRVDQTKYPDVERIGEEEYYKTFQITDTLSFKLEHHIRKPAYATRLRTAAIQ